MPVVARLSLHHATAQVMYALQNPKQGSDMTAADHGHFLQLGMICFNALLAFLGALTLHMQKVEWQVWSQPASSFSHAATT